MRTDDLLFTSGLFCAVLGAGLCQFVVVGLIGLGFFAVAFGLLLVAGIVARPSSRFSVWQQVSGGVLFGVGIVLLLAVAGVASGLAYDQAMSSLRSTPPPSAGRWVILGLSSLVPALVILLGIRLRAGWPWRRCSVWGIAGWGVVPLALLLFWIFSANSFAAKWPLTT